MGRTKCEAKSAKHLKGKAQPDVTQSRHNATSQQEVTQPSADVTTPNNNCKVNDDNIYSQRLKDLSSVHHKQTDRRDFFGTEFAFSRKLMELAKHHRKIRGMAKAGNLEKRQKLETLYEETTDYYNDDNDNDHLKRRERISRKRKSEDYDFTRRLVALTVKKKRFQPQEHAHCCRCVQSFECFWPRSNLQTVRMQDYHVM